MFKPPLPPHRCCRSHTAAYLPQFKLKKNGKKINTKFQETKMSFLQFTH